MFHFKTNWGEDVHGGISDCKKLDGSGVEKAG